MRYRTTWESDSLTAAYRCLRKCALVHLENFHTQCDAGSLYVYVSMHKNLRSATAGRTGNAQYY